MGPHGGDAARARPAYIRPRTLLRRHFGSHNRTVSIEGEQTKDFDHSFRNNKSRSIEYCLSFLKQRDNRPTLLITSRLTQVSPNV